MELIRITNAELAFGDAKILDDAELRINQGERVCLLAAMVLANLRLLKIVSGRQQLDDGQLTFRTIFALLCLSKIHRRLAIKPFSIMFLKAYMPMQSY